MNSIRQFPRSLLTATWKFSRRNSTSVADSFGQNVKVDNIQNSSQFFPWRQRPLNPRHRSPLNKFILSLLLSEIEPTPQFLQGAQAAFESAVYAIFHHPDLITHNKAIQFQRTSNPNDKSEVTPSDQSADILTINEVFEERLANFYTNAIKNVRLQPHYRVFHQIHSIRQPQITRSDLLLYSSVDKVEHEFLERIDYPYGLGGRLKPQSKENVPGSKVHDNIDDDSYNIITNLKSKNHGGNEPDSVLLRVWVDVNSQEIFYIKDVERDVFIQGNDVSRSTTHEILLENTLRIEDIFQLKLEYTDEWKLVDIDQWIEHNDDWLQYRFSSK